MLTRDEERAFCAIADTLIPASGKMPSFSHSAAPKLYVDRVLGLRPELLADLKSALKLASDFADPAATAEWLNREHPAALGVIGLVASSAYYLDPGIREKLGYAGQQHRPATEGEEYDYEDLLQPVVDRGPIYRPTTKG
jgi:hypothetical protein